jgi:hypothetical protein
MAHWGGPVKMIDLSRATPHIKIAKSESEQILREVNYKINHEDLVTLFEYLSVREIVDIDFSD